MSSALGILVPEFPQQTHIFFWREIAMLREMGVEVALLSTRKPSPEACRHDFAAQAREETHYVYPPRLPESLQWLSERPAAALRALRYVAGLRESSLKQKARAAGLLMCAADLAAHAKERSIRHIHAHSCADAAHVVAMASLLEGPSYSLTLHGDLPVYGTDHASKTKRAVCIGCDGPHLVPQLVRGAGYPVERVLPNWMGLDTTRFASEGRNWQRPGPLALLTVARLNRTKGHVHALRALRMALDAGCDLRYSLAGEGPYRGEIEAEIQRLGLTEHVRLLGTQSEAQVLQLLCSHDVFVLPSTGLGEAGPISLMEAMSAGLPSVVSIIGSTPHMVEDGKSGILVDQGDERALCAAFVRLSQDADYRARLSVAARERAVRAFDCRKTTARLLEFIETHGRFQLAKRPSDELFNARAGARPRSSPILN